MCYLYGISKCQVCLSCKLCAINPLRNKTFLKCYLKKKKMKRDCLFPTIQFGSNSNVEE